MSQVRIMPQPGGQVEFLQAGAFEVLGGGSAGGGKSWTLVLDALGICFQNEPLGQAAYRTPGYRGVLFRRETGQLAKLLDEAHRFYPALGGVYTAQRKGDPGACYEFPEYGSKVFFCHLENEMDKENHQGAEYQFVGFDELTQFTLTQYLYLFSRCRSTIPHLRPRIRATCNPTGIGLWWVKRRFIQNCVPKHTYYWVSDSDPMQNPQGIRVNANNPMALSRAFIPMWLHENRLLMTADPSYGSRISAMGKQMEKALLKGDWDAFGGIFFPTFDRSTEKIAPFTIPDMWRLIGSLDVGGSSPCSFGLQTCSPEGKVYRIATYYERMRNPIQHADAIKVFIKSCPWTKGRHPELIVSGHDAWAKNDRWAVYASENTFAEVMAAKGIFMDRALLDRKQGWGHWKSLMPRQYFVFDGLNNDLLDEMTAAAPDPKNPDDITGGGNDASVMDHALDEQRYGLMAMRPSVIVPTPDQVMKDYFDAAAQLGGMRARDGWRPGDP